jgi:prepilin peptidase CpaA
MGAGDVKLLAAVGSVVGPQGIIGVFILTGLVGGLLAIVVLVLRRWSAHIANRFVRALILDPRMGETLVERVPVQRVGVIPYGIAISVGTWVFIAMLGGI